MYSPLAIHRFDSPSHLAQHSRPAHHSILAVPSLYYRQVHGTALSDMQPSLSTGSNCLTGLEHKRAKLQRTPRFPRVEDYPLTSTWP